MQSTIRFQAQGIGLRFGKVDAVGDYVSGVFDVAGLDGDFSTGRFVPQ